MKKGILIILLVLMVLSCGTSKKVTLPDKDIKIENETVFFKNEKYTGKINLKDKNSVSGFITFKDGHLDGPTELKNDKKQMYTKFNIVNNQFEGETVVKNADQGINMTVNYNNGKIVKLLGDYSKTVKYDITFVDGLANGWFESEGEKFVFSDGVLTLEEDGITTEVKYYVNQETGDMGMEFFINGKSAGRDEKPNKVFGMEYFRIIAISSILEENSKGKDK
ncbi:Uncharacterised protein [Sebaldella termitidis]|jgi:hypothetical protein|uniref:MORN variant repeat protein n=1 Tax=Sebaldella termitidis (strain ATCC 33386 / NCTC 11300) TaxID=526218 RepID=D1AGQ9_SEBTE|nr:hypothetical protein [Sebaldella termitidis]ACZ10779.1 hypothetical protein Sterm_3946 [Sebaldella termitidis ATCC 33386]MBP7979024.1 hypothetical protein [Sebaldella sp.]SUI26122.1 Uncharacterised protein [Sebaldella termitidis]